MSLRSRPGLAALILCGCCVLWGLSFPLMPIVSDGLATAVQRHGLPDNTMATAATLNAWRYGVAAVLTALLAASRWQRLVRREVSIGFALGGLFAGGMILQTLGLRWIVPSLAGVLTALSVIFAPLAQMLLFRQRVGGLIWIAALIALVGVALLTQQNQAATIPGSLTVTPPFPYAGEICTLLGSLFFTGQILCVDRFAGQVDPLRLTAVVFFFVALLSALTAVVCGGATQLTLFTDSSLIRDGRWLGALLALVVLCSVVAITLMTTFQPAIPAATASVIYCLEPVFAVVFSLLLGQEQMTCFTAIGGSLVVGATVLVAVGGRVSGRP